MVLSKHWWRKIHDWFITEINTQKLRNNPIKSEGGGLSSKSDTKDQMMPFQPDVFWKINFYSKIRIQNCNCLYTFFNSLLYIFWHDLTNWFIYFRFFNSSTVFKILSIFLYFLLILHIHILVVVKCPFYSYLYLILIQK